MDTTNEVNEAVRKYNSLGKKLTYADYASWDDDNRYELIDGVVHAMSAPSLLHQNISMELSRQLANYLVGKPCRVLAAPSDVCLFGKGDEDDTVVQPDVLVICDERKLENGKYCNGAPDLVIEILSSSTASLDRIKKLNIYLQSGVREYWIIDPIDNSVVVNVLENSKYVISNYKGTDTVPVFVLDGCNISLADVFQ